MSKSYSDLVAMARAAVTEVTASAVAMDLAAAGTLLDVREADEWEQGIIPGAVHVPRGTLESAIGRVAPDPHASLTLYCAVGARSALAALSLQAMGYTNVRSLEGGFAAWKAAALPWDLPETFTNDQRARYARHVMLPEVGESGQRRLLGGRALIVGAGGLGSPVALYLAAAGVGTIGLVDFDRVDASNLQRQILHDLNRIGETKVESARQSIGALNSDVKVETYDLRLAAANVLDVAAGYDVIVDGADNFPTRYLLNDASIHLGIPVVHGSIFRFEGQVSVFDPRNGPCYRCLFPEAPPPELAPNCAEAGVLGVLPGVIGTLQATEAIKLILGIGEPLIGRLLTYDALDQEFRTLRISKQADCPACSAGLPAIVDYVGACRAERR
jgi:adenylyltransferase/sulfurtransferase